MTEYQIFVRRFADLTPGRHILFIKDLTPGPRKYDTRLVQAEVSDKPDSQPDWDRLWLRSEAGRKLDKPWAVQVIEELGETVEGGPYDDVFLITQAMTKNLQQPAK